MKIKIDRIALDFMATAIKVTEGISPEAVLYWARNEKKLAALLEMKDFDPLTQIRTEPYVLAGMAETTRARLWNRRAVHDHNFDQFVAKIAKGAHPATESCHVYSYQMNVPLFGKELVEEIGGVDILMSSAFTYSQIVGMAGRHSNQDNPTGKSVTMDYEQPNYFPMIERGGELTLVSLFSRKDFRKHKKWQAWFPGIDSCNWLHGVLHIRQDIENANLHV